MKNFLKKCSRKLRRLCGKPLTSEEFADILREKGVSVGKKTVFFHPESNYIDAEHPWMLQIGNYCKITHGVVILCHDYSRSVLRRVKGDLLCEAGKTVIGDNVFLGVNAIVLMGANIGDNVVIGAGSVVSGTIPANSVAAGNPARVIRTLDEQYERRKARQVEEAKLYARTFYEAYRRYPTVSEMGAFFPLYLKRDAAALKRYGLRTALSGDEESEVIADFLASEPVYESYEAFLRDAFQGEAP